MTEDLQKQISDYIEGKMTTTERESFERTINDDPNLLEEVNDLKALESGLHAAGLEQFRNDLKLWEQDMALSGGHKASWKNFLAVAAVVTLVVIPTLYLFKSNKPTSEELFLSYYEPYEEMITSRGNSTDSTNLLLAEGMEAYNTGNYEKCSDLLKTYLNDHSDARVTLYLAIAQLELNQIQLAEANFLQAQKDPMFRQQAQWYQALSYLKLTDTEKARMVLESIVTEDNHYRNAQASKLLKEMS